MLAHRTIALRALVLAGAVLGSASAAQDDDRPSDILYLAPGEVPTAGIRASIERRAPKTAGWRSEEMHDLAYPELKAFVERVARNVSVNELSRYLAPSFAGTTHFVPESLEQVFDDGSTRVRIAKSYSTKTYGRDDIPKLVAELTAPFGGPRAGSSSPTGTKVKLFTSVVDPVYPRRFNTRALVRFDGKADDDGLLQINSEWDISWEVLEREPDEIARIRTIALVRYEDIRARAPIFAEITDAVLSGVPRYASEFLLGSGEYHFRTDSLNGNVYSGLVGIAIGDVNGDGRDDLFVPQHGGLPNRMLIHRADGTVEDVSEKSGLAVLEDTHSALFLDVDNDGDQDIALSWFNSIVIGTNDGTGTFALDRRALVDRDTIGEIKSLAAADWDADGDLDLYACVYSNLGPLGTIPVPYYDATNAPGNLAWRNDGEGVWTNVTDEIGLGENNNKFSYAAIFDDFDNDRDLDLYVVNDFGRNNLYRNDDGRFHDVAVEAGADDMAAGMGVSAADIDNDGDVDLYVTNMWSSAGRRIATQDGNFRAARDAETRENYLRHARGNTLLLNRGDGTFDDVTVESGAMNGGWAWGALTVDLNNDGFEDVYSPNGFISGDKNTGDL